VKKLADDRLFMKNRTKLDPAEPMVQLNFDPKLIKSVQTQDARAVNQQSAGQSLSAEMYYEAGKKLEDENCNNKAIKYFQKSLACIPNFLGITSEYSRYLFYDQQPPVYNDDFVSEIYAALARCLYRQKRIEDAWLATRAALVCHPENESADKLAQCLITDLQKSQQNRIDINNHSCIRANLAESTTSRKAGGLDYTAIGGKRQGREVPPIVENNAVEPSAKHPVWKPQSDLENKLTILMVTNFTKKLEKFAHLSPPGAGLVKTTYGSMLHVFGKRLSKCKKILCYDRKHIGDENENMYQARLTKFAESQDFDFNVAVRFGLQKIIRKILEKVTTPYLLFLEHDWEFQGPEIDLENLIGVFDQNEMVNYVRFNKRKNVISNFDFILEKETSIKDIDLIRTVAHSNNPHLVRVEKLRKDWLPICLNDPLCQKMDLRGKAFGIENPLFKRHLHDVREMGFAQAQEKWGTYIYGEIGDPPRIKHLGE
jgi:hypothetical protein